MRMFAVATMSAVACSSAAPPPPRAPAEAAPAVSELQAGHFTEAQRAATTTLAGDPSNSRAATVRAIALYADAADRFGADVTSLVSRDEIEVAFASDAGRQMWTRALAALDAVDADLAIAERDPQFSLELCIACWPARDWNHDGKIDDRDQHLFEIDLDGSGNSMPPDDPRRKPTFRFDRGDILWGRAMVHFQHAFIELVLAYKWTEAAKLFAHDSPDRVVISVLDKSRVVKAREDLLAALDFSAREREAYLAETDDDREWVPNPRQHSHPIPLEMDDAMYTKWPELLADVRRLITSDDGLSIRELAGTMGEHGGDIPDAYLDIGKMLQEPQDIVLETAVMKKPIWDKMLANVFGHGFTMTPMHSSPLIRRIEAMAKELDHGEDTLDRKLHYLFWLN